MEELQSAHQMPLAPVTALTVGTSFLFIHFTLNAINFKRRYSCMYTKDVHKKAKIWHDGYILFHHLTSKAVLMDDDFVSIDEVFYKIRGVALAAKPNRQASGGVPREVVLANDTKIDFEKHVGVIEDLVFESEKDVSEIFKRREKKDPEALDDLADRGSSTGPRKRKFASMTSQKDCDGPGQIAGRYTDGCVDSPTQTSGALPSFGRNLCTPVRPVLYSSTTLDSRRALSGGHISKSTLTGSAKLQAPAPDSIRSKQPVSNTSRLSGTTTPFKPPSFLRGQSDGTPIHSSTPSRMSPATIPEKRKMLGTSRPSSALARQTLQASWAKFTESHPITAISTSAPAQCARRTKPRESEEEKAQRRQSMLQELSKEGEQVIIQTHQKRLDGEKGDTSGWLFD